MDYLSYNISENVKRIRRSRGYSLDAVAEQTGVSKSMLAQIEKGNANPSIGVLGKIASGLRISFTDLISSPPMESCLVNVKDIVPIKEVDGQYKVWTCFPYEDNQQVEIYRIEILPGGVYMSGSHGENTREYLSVLSGELTVEINDGKHIIRPEDIFRFESDQTHRYYNNTKELLRFDCFFVTY